MRRSLAAIHVVALALWLGALVFSFLLAKTLFDATRPVCPACLKVALSDKDVLAACDTCGALHHGTCASAGCALEHQGTHVLSQPSGVAVVATTGLAQWSRVRVNHERGAPERR